MDKQKFLEKFDLQKYGFTEPVAFYDAVGFSTTKERQQNNHTFVSIYKFSIENSDLAEESNLKAITISVSYAEKLDDGTLRLSPTSIKRKLNWPIDLYSKDEFFYNPTSDKFYYKNKEVAAEEIIKKIELLHTKPTKPLRGSVLIFKLFFWRIIATHFFKVLYYAFIAVLYILSGTKTNRSIWINIREASLNNDKIVQKESFAEETIEIFGYKASAWSVVVYAFLHITTYSVWYFYFDFESDFLKSVFSNVFLTTVYVIPSLVFFERLIPNLLEVSIELSGINFHKTSFRQIKI